jgi:hypothetical protein
MRGSSDAGTGDVLRVAKADAEESREPAAGASPYGCGPGSEEMMLKLADARE